MKLKDKIRNNSVKFVCVVLLLACNYNESLYAQRHTYLNCMEKFYDAGVFNTATFPENNFNGDIVDRSYELEAVLVMYKKTNKIKWLHTFVALADRVLNARDDMHKTSYTSSTNPIANYLGNIEATWVNESYYPGYRYAPVYHSGMLTQSIAEFCYIISQTPVYFQSVFANNANGFFYTTQSMKSIADDLIMRLKQTVISHEKEWKDRLLPNGAIGGNYYYDCNIHTLAFLKVDDVLPGGTVPLNMQAAFGKTLLYLYLSLPQTDTDKNVYFERVIRISNTLRYNMVSETPLGTSHYIWRYWDTYDHPVLPEGGRYTNDCSRKIYPDGFGASQIEDWGHAIINVSFAYLCHKHGIPYSLSTTSLVFDTNDMKKIAATFKNFYLRPMMYFENIDRTFPLYYQQYNFTYPDDIAGLAHWLMYSEFDKDIYQMVSEIYTKYALNLHLPSWPGVLGIAYSHFYKNELNPIDMGEGGAGSNWAGSAIGDLNNDGQNEVASVRNGDGDIFITNWQPIAGKLHENGLVPVQTLPNGDASNWKGITIGNFDGQPGNELAAIRNFDNTVYIWKNNAAPGSINLSGWANIPVNFATNWAGIAAGNFDISDAADELALLSNSTGDTYIYDFNTNTGSFYLKATLNNSNNSQWSGIAAGNVNNDVKDEIIQASNLDGDIVIYSLNGININQLGQKYDAPANMDWRGITTGDFDLDGNEEIAINAHSDGDLYFFSFAGQTISGFKRIHFTGPVNGSSLQNGILASGNVSGTNSDCVTEIINFRNNDGWNYLYEYEKPIDLSNIHHPCNSIEHGKGKKLKQIIELDTYPNPVSGTLNIELKNDVEVEAPVKLALLNTHGIILKEIILSELNTGFTVLKMDVSNFPAGLYFIDLTYDNERITEKIVIGE